MTGYSKSHLIRIRAILVEVATRRQTITYSALAKRARLKWNHKVSHDRLMIGALLGDISNEEYARGRPLLTAVVVQKKTGRPGLGFQGLVLLKGFPSTPHFWDIELKRAHDFWAWSAG